MRNLLLALIAVLVIAACSKEPKPVSFYKENHAARKEVLSKLKENPGKYKNDPDVINAVQAETEILFSFKPEPVTQKGAGTFQLK